MIDLSFMVCFYKIQDDRWHKPENNYFFMYENTCFRKSTMIRKEMLIKIQIQIFHRKKENNKDNEKAGKINLDMSLDSSC